MSLQTDIQPYIDGYGLISPSPVAPGAMQGSDNGVMFTVEYLLMLPVEKRPLQQRSAIVNCFDEMMGLLSRTPRLGLDGQDQVDNYYALMNYVSQVGYPLVARDVLKAVWRYKGALNNVSPGVWTKESFLIRQPQLLCAMITAAYPELFKPKHLCIRVLCFPLYAITAAVMATSCMFTPVGETDGRRLSWHLVQTLKNKSILCWLASKLWYHRLYKDYGPTGMRAVAEIYYSKGHPFAKHWID